MTRGPIIAFWLLALALTAGDANFAAFDLAEARATPDGDLLFGKALARPAKNEVLFPGEINMDRGLIEVAVCSFRGRTHEALVVTAVNPFHLQLALIALGASNGAAAPGGDTPEGQRVALEAEGLYAPFLTPGVPPLDRVIEEQAFRCRGVARAPLADWLWDKTRDTRPALDAWVFVGSRFDPQKRCLATLEGNLVEINSYDENTVLLAPSDVAAGDKVFTARAEVAPPTGTALTLIVRPLAKTPPPSRPPNF